MRRCQLLQALDGLDGSLMTSVVKRFENVAPVVEQVTVPDIEREVVMLQSFATPDKNSSPLAGIDFESAIRFKDGIRAPPWRQDKGDLCYLMVSLHDAGNICLTCNREKIFQNGGNVTDEHGMCPCYGEWKLLLCMYVCMCVCVCAFCVFVCLRGRVRVVPPDSRWPRLMDGV